MKNKNLIILNILLLILVLLLMQYKGINDRYYINNDVNLLFFINLPDNDNLIAQYSMKLQTASIYLAKIYILINKFIDFIYFAKVVSIFTFLLSVIFIYKLGRAIKDKRYALILTFLFILQPWAIQPFAGGLSRSFVFPLLTAFLYYLIKKDILKLSFVLLFQAMLYPATWLISILTFGFSLIDIKRRRINLNIKQNYLFFIFVVLSFIVLAPFILVYGGMENKITLAEAIHYPEFYEGGRLQIFAGSIPFTSDIKSTIQTLISVYNPRIYRPFHASPLFILLLLSFIFMLIYRKRIFRLPKEAFLFIISSLILQSLAFILFPILYLPVRYAQYSVPLFLIIILANGLYFIKKKCIFAILVILLIAFYVPKIDDSRGYCEDKSLYNYIKTLPVNAFIAGHPSDMNCIAMFGERNPFIIGELNIPIHEGYYGVIKKRNFDFFSAYYSESKQEMQNFCKDNGITHLIVNKDHFDEGFLNKSRIFYEPFNSHIKSITKNRKDFYLQNPDNIVFESGNKLVVSCGS